MELRSSSSFSNFNKLAYRISVIWAFQEREQTTASSNTSGHAAAVQLQSTHEEKADDSDRPTGRDPASRRQKKSSGTLRVLSRSYVAGALSLVITKYRPPALARNLHSCRMNGHQQHDEGKAYNRRRLANPHLCHPRHHQRDKKLCNQVKRIITFDLCLQS